MYYYPVLLLLLCYYYCTTTALLLYYYCTTTVPLLYYYYYYYYYYHYYYYYYYYYYDYYCYCYCTTCTLLGGGGTNSIKCQIRSEVRKASIFAMRRRRCVVGGAGLTHCFGAGWLGFSQVSLKRHPSTFEETDTCHYSARCHDCSCKRAASRFVECDRTRPSLSVLPISATCCIKTW